MMPRRIPTTAEQQASGDCWWLRWGISLNLALRLMHMAAELAPIPVNIISGYRTPEEQNKLRAEGRPTAANDRSTHLSCPATGADLSLPTLATIDSTKALLGRAATFAGLRWGGGSRPNSAGIPGDWNHVDLGPREA